MQPDVLLHLIKIITIRLTRVCDLRPETYLEEYQTAWRDVELPQCTVVGSQVFSIEKQALIDYGDLEPFVDLRELSLAKQGSLLNLVKTHLFL